MYQGESTVSGLSHTHIARMPFAAFFFLLFSLVCWWCIAWQLQYHQLQYNVFDSFHSEEKMNDSRWNGRNLFRIMRFRGWFPGNSPFGRRSVKYAKDLWVWNVFVFRFRISQFQVLPNSNVRLCYHFIFFNGQHCTQRVFAIPIPLEANAWQQIRITNFEVVQFSFSRKMVWNL